MKHLQLEQTSNGELKPLQQSNNNENNPLQMLQSSVDRASDLNQKIMTSEENQKSENQAEFSSRMAAMAAMFPNLPSSITASLAFPSSQSKSTKIGKKKSNDALKRTKSRTNEHFC